MDVKKQQMRLQLQQQQQQQQQQQPPQKRHNRTGFETLLDQLPTEQQVTSSPPPNVVQSRGVSVPWSPTSAGRHQEHAYYHGNHYDGRGRGGASPTAVGHRKSGSPPSVTQPPPTSPLSLPSPYYDRNPNVAFPFHHHHHHHRVSKSPAFGGTAATAATAATVPLANVQNVVYAGVVDPDHNDHHNSNTSKHYHQWYHHQNHKPGDMMDGRDDDKENIKQQDAECLQQQLDEVLRACVDYEERHRGRQVSATESSENTSLDSNPTMSPQQNRIKTNGSLPRDAKKPGTDTSSPASPSSATWPLTPSPTVLSPLSPPAVLSPLSPLSPPAMSPLSLTGDNDSVFLENDCFPPSSTAPSDATAARGSPGTGVGTLGPPGQTAATAATVATADELFGGKEQAVHRRRQYSDDEGGIQVPPASLLWSKPSDRLQPLSSQSTLQSPAWQTTSTWLRSSPFAVDSTDGGVGTPTATTVSGAATERSAESAEQRRKLLVELSAHKSRLVELHLRREEIDRELIIETALLRAELDAADDETRQSDNIIDGLDHSVAECRQQMDLCTVKQQDQRTAADSQLVKHRQELQGLRSRLESIEDSEELKTEIRTSIEMQTELLEAEQKLYEDVEFGLLEEEAGWLARREELHRDRASAVAVRRARRARAEWLRAQLDQLRSVGDDQLRALRHDINATTLSIQQGHKKLHDLDVASAAASEQQRSLEWTWDQQSKSPISPMSSSSMSWDRQSKSPGFSSWSPTCANNVGLSSSLTADSAVSNYGGPMTSSMTTTCCSSMGSSGGEDDGCRPASEDSVSQMSMSTIFSVKMRPKNKSPLDITKRPLTRYLPIRYDGDGVSGNQVAFDLRAHIESAGHQLDDDGAVDDRGVDKHFWIDSSSCRGYLKKLSGAGGKNSHRSGRKWLKRWFVFDRRSKTLSYYHRRCDEDNTVAGNQRSSSMTKTHPRVSIRFQDIQEVYVDHTNSSKGQGCAFVVKTVQRTFYLSAATGQAVRVWVDVIFTGAEGYREYLKCSADDGISIATPRNDDDRRVQQTKS